MRADGRSVSWRESWRGGLRPGFASRRALYALLAALTASVTAQARADDTKRVLVIVGPTGGSGKPAELERETRAAVAKLSFLELLPPPPLDLEAVQLAIDCTDESPSCLSAVAHRLEAQVLVVPSVARRGGSLVLRLMRFDAEGEGEPRSVSRGGRGSKLTRAQLAALDGMVHELFEAEQSAAEEAANRPAEAAAPEPKPAETAAPARATPADRGGAVLPLPPLLVAGAGVVAITAGVVMFAAMKATEHNYAALPVTTAAQADAAERTRTLGHHQALAASLLLGVGGAAIAAGGVWLALDLDRAIEARPDRDRAGAADRPARRRSGRVRDLGDEPVTRARCSSAWLGLLLVLPLAGVAGCSFHDKANGAHGCDSSCPPGHCYLDYCLADATGGLPATGEGGSGSGLGGAQGGGAGSTAGGSGSGSVGSGSPTPQGNCVAGAPCYLGPPETRGKGICRDGKAQCNGTSLQACVGQLAPVSEACNGADDDCDGKVDEEIALGSCPVTGQGACGAGVLACEQGVPVCRAGGGPSAEVCNGIDDDCDGVIDNGTDVNCYPADMPGCTADGSGGFACTGVCKAGKRVCKDGKLQACGGAVVPSQEVCGGTEAADENCNGQIDDGCPCTGSQTQRCYGGPARTAGVGICRAGTQTCHNGAFGACEGSVVPGTESCANPGSDDDCNRLTDDVPGLGLLCLDFAKQGVCLFGTQQCKGSDLVCVTPTPQSSETACDGSDEDCDGYVDEDFQLATDPQNCGACGTRCGAGAECCAGVCRDVSSDPQYCGSCGNACGASSACCGGTCVPTTTVDHCGGCGGCSAGQACCGGACIDTGSVDHCGGCGGCGAGQACCGNACVDTGSVDHCGGCGGCGAGQACCGNACVDTGSVDHCGGCGGCGAGQACCPSGCVDIPAVAQCCDATSVADACGACSACPNGQACCQGGCTDTSTDDMNCGGCGNACTGDGCHCASGQCMDGSNAPCP